MTGSNAAWIAGPRGPLLGRARVPGDKSVSHRAVMLGALADGVTEIAGFLEGEDTIATARAFARMGVRIDTPGEGIRTVHGVGLRGLRPPGGPIDCGNAGTGMRLLAGVLAGQSFDATLTGDASLSARPMRRVTDPLASMGALIESTGGLPPLHVRGGQSLHGIDIELQVASAQVKSAILLAGLYAQGATTVVEPHPTRDYTERMLAAFGWPIDFSPGRARITGGHRLTATRIDVPADVSSAAFAMVGATIVPGSDITLEAVGINPRRTGLLHALRAMGADIGLERERMQGGEPVADIRVRHAPLHGIEVDSAWVPDMIDEFPALFVAAACADGVTVVRDASELRVKESDRIAAMARGLQSLGIDVREAPDGATITGGALRGGVIDSAGDHRIAMSFAMAAQVALAPVRIGDVANVATSFPGFMALMQGLGAGLEPAH